MRKHVMVAVVVASFSVVGCVSSSSAATSNVVLGSPAFAPQGGEGWGTAQPAKIYNGGDPSGLVREIHWVDWGASSAIGYGLHAIFKPHGGYYSEPVLTELRATGLGKCGGGPRAYTLLYVRDPQRPDGPAGPWYLWSEAKSLCRSGF